MSFGEVVKERGNFVFYAMKCAFFGNLYFSKHPCQLRFEIRYCVLAATSCPKVLVVFFRTYRRMLNNTENRFGMTIHNAHLSYFVLHDFYDLIQHHKIT